VWGLASEMIYNKDNDFDFVNNTEASPSHAVRPGLILTLHLKLDLNSRSHCYDLDNISF